MKTPKRMVRLGMSLEAFGVTVTTCGIAEMSRWVLLTGVITSAIGRGLTIFFKDETDKPT